MQRTKRLLFSWTLLAALMVAGLSTAAGAKEADQASNQVFDPKLFSGMEYRSLGFSRGGRSTAVTGVPGQTEVYYFGSTGGGVWKSENGGHSWRNISDDDFEVGSIGSVAVAPSDPNVIYVGTGSACPRGNVSSGNGVYKSTDAGRSWKHIGLPEAGQIGRIRVHPSNPDLVYAAVLGHIFGHNEERGVYRSKDGGANWEKVLYVSDQTGAVDLSMDATNPRILYAAMWTTERKPWTLISGSKEGGIYKSTDSGDNWEKLAGGLPDGLVGKIGVAVSPADPDRVWAVIEADKKKGGIYRSEDAGKTWRRINQEARFIQRPWYYNHIFADTKSANTVYVLNTGMYRSNDGGSNWERIGTPHGDNHDLWINPDHPEIMIESNDGGANVSFDGGESWTDQMGQPTAEIYRVTVDEQYPYRVYGAQQDNSTISVPSRAGRGVVPDWYAVGGCESGHVAVDPRNPDITYAGCYGGNINRVNRATGEERDILVYPQLQLGQAPRDLKYRFQWNAPIRISPHDPSVLYHTSQVVHRSRDEGQSWEEISPDLTRNDKEKQGYAGGPISHDSTGVEVYDVIFAFEESPYERGLLWAGSDDGLVNVSRNNGKDWEDVTPADMPEWGTVNMIEISPHGDGRAFIAVYRYRRDDFAPYVFRTDDYGKTWVKLTDGSNGIPADQFVRVVREDPERKGLLYAGTEFGMYISFDDGAHWQPFQLNLPVTPVTDLAVHRNNLVVATQGRAFWQLDDLSPLRQLDNETPLDQPHLFQPSEAYRADFGDAAIYYYLPEEPEGEVKLEILDKDGEVVNTFKGKAGDEEGGGGPPRGGFGFGRGRGSRLPVKAGLNRFAWNLRYPNIEIPRGVVLWGRPGGLTAVPGEYKARLTSGDWTSETHPFPLRKDPRIKTTQAELEEQFQFVQKVGKDIESLYAGLKRLRDVRSQVDQLNGRIKESGKSSDELQEAAKTLKDKLKAVEEQLTQPKSESNQDPLNFPPQLDNQYTTLYNYAAGGDYKPTAGAYERYDDLKAQLDPLLKQLNQILDEDLKAYTKLVDKLDLDPIILSSDGK